ncbi:MAG: hemolysin III family protein [Candidatus Hydrogenedentes bacterium]|nr:hemolysin III family protein [Candidatus Hydrogenedentota bacterium]
MDTPRYGFVEEVANAITHGIGLALSIAGLTLLVTFAGLTGDPWRIVSFTIYGATLVVLYFSSTLYHGLPIPAAKQILRRIDHASIFLLIAGTYTPFVLVVLRGGLGWTLFGIVWALAAFGVAVKVAFIGRFEVLTVFLYLGMGWMGVMAIKPMIGALPPSGLALVVAGGLAYTVGVIFYAGRCIPFNHAIWHVFVITGSVCHFLAVILFVL